MASAVDVPAAVTEGAEGAPQLDSQLVADAAQGDAAAAAPAPAPVPVPVAAPAASAPAQPPAVHEAKRFLLQHKEKLQMNQYWYSLPTIAAMVHESERSASRACFLSTPSIYFSLNDKQLQDRSKVLDYDEMWSSHPGFVKYDYKKPEEIPASLHHSFDFVVIDPPFITAEVWAEYAKAAKLLLVPGEEDVEVDSELADAYHASMVRAHAAGVASLRGDVVGTSFAGNIASMLGSVLGGAGSASASKGNAAVAALRAPVPPRPSPSDPTRSIVTVPRGKLLLSTIPEHEGYLYVLLGCAQPRFRPSIPNLIYQYSLYVNYPSAPLWKLNPEIDDEEPVKASSKKKSSIQM